MFNAGFSQYKEKRRKLSAEALENTILNEVRFVDLFDKNFQGLLKQVVTIYNHPKMGWHFNKPPKTSQELAESLQQSKGKTRLYVAESTTGVVLGTFTLEEKAEKAVNLLKVAQNPQYPGLSIGNQLIMHAKINSFLVNNYEEIRLKMSRTPDWEVAYRLYRRNGFQVIGTSTKQKDLGNGIVIENCEVLEMQLQKAECKDFLSRAKQLYNLHAFQ